MHRKLTVNVTESLLYGDVNNDGKVSIEDAILILRHIVKLTDLAEVYGAGALARAKVSGDDAPVNVKDAILVLRHVAGLMQQVPKRKNWGQMIWLLK